jgi:hypothetical protein
MGGAKGSAKRLVQQAQPLRNRSIPRDIRSIVAQTPRPISLLTAGRVASIWDAQSGIR